MIIIKVLDGNIERALKELKRKFTNLRIAKQLCDRQEYTKPSVIKRRQRQRAIYANKFKLDS